MNLSSDYVIARAKLLNEYFSQREWVVSAGGNNAILIYLYSGDEFPYSEDELAEILAESDFHVPATGLKMTAVTYLFYYRGELKAELELLPGSEFDIYED